jgi:hypothetical protein
VNFALVDLRDNLREVITSLVNQISDLNAQLIALEKSLDEELRACLSRNESIRISNTNFSNENSRITRSIADLLTTLNHLTVNFEVCRNDFSTARERIDW